MEDNALEVAVDLKNNEGDLICRGVLIPSSVECRWGFLPASDCTEGQIGWPPVEPLEISIGIEDQTFAATDARVCGGTHIHLEIKRLKGMSDLPETKRENKTE